jgi:hypothetical protein
MNGRAEEQHGDQGTRPTSQGVRIYDRPDKTVNKRLLLSLWLVFLLVLMVLAILWLRR